MIFIFNNSFFDRRRRIIQCPETRTRYILSQNTAVFLDSRLDCSRSHSGPIGPIGPTGPTGSKGEKGETGDKGPDGDVGQAEALYALQSEPQSVTSMNALPLTLNTATPKSTKSIDADCLKLKKGYHHLSFGFTLLNSTLTTPITVRLYANSMPIEGETIVAGEGNGKRYNKSLIYYAKKDTTLQLKNISQNTATLSSIYLISIKLASDES